ncbi:MAG: glycoside hydrolase family 43 protein, partial [Verrucomicrobiales bacterium]
MDLSNAQPGKTELRYQNPVYPYYFADPFVWKHEGKYYAVGTGPIAEQEASGEGDFTTYMVGGKEMAIPLLVSNDLVHWKLHGGAYEVPEFAHGAVFWAPEVAFHDGVFYLYFSFAKEDLKHQLRVAASRSPSGPFVDAGALLPPTDNCSFAIDAHAFRDDDGQWYLFYARDFLDYGERIRAGTALVVDRLVNMTRLAGKPQTVMRATCDWQRFQADRPMYGQIFDWHTLEGPCVRKRNGNYYCFYSGGCYQGEGYGVDYGISDHVLGPYSDEGNESGARVLRTVSGKIIGPGHHSIVEGPDGKTDFIVYHAWDPKMTARRMFIDPLEWTAEGPRCQG